jgi:hypothetical protein
MHAKSKRHKTMTNQKQIRAAFWESFPHLEKHALKWGIKTAPQNRHNTETRAAFVDFVDHRQKSEQITESLANRATL